MAFLLLVFCLLSCVVSPVKAFNYSHYAFRFSQGIGISLTEDCVFKYGFPQGIQYRLAFAFKNNHEIHFSPSIGFISGSGYEYGYSNEYYQVWEFDNHTTELDINGGFTYVLPLSSNGKLRLSIGTGVGPAVIWGKEHLTMYPNAEKVDGDPTSYSDVFFSCNIFTGLDMAIINPIHVFTEIRAKIGDYDFIKVSLGVSFSKYRKKTL